jgi:hypothetical protein
MKRASGGRSRSCASWQANRRSDRSDPDERPSEGVENVDFFVYIQQNSDMVRSVGALRGSDWSP